MGDDEMGQVRIANRGMLDGVNVEEVIQFKETMQAALDIFEEETGNRVVICAIDWAVQGEKLNPEPEAENGQRNSRGEDDSSGMG